MPGIPSRLSAILLAVLVTFLWSTSWILIKFGLSPDLPPVTFAGLRYTLAFLSLSPFVLLRSRYRQEVFHLEKKDLSRLAILGVITFTITQAAVFLSLAYLPAAMLNLVLNLTSLFVAITGIFFLHEMPSPLQWLGILMAALGTGIFFLPIALSSSQWIGLLFALLCLGFNVPASLLGRHINREARFSPLIVTWVSMGIGSLLMLAIGLLTQGMGHLSTREWLIIAWLAVVNTALTFTIWNHTLRVLTAMESSIINNLMMPQIAVLAWFFLKENLSPKEIIGLVLAGVGVLIVQMRRPDAVRRTELFPERTV